jgi:uncharacterized ferredoxin-like protein
MTENAVIDYSKAQDDALKDGAEFMALAARTAPKTCGRDNLEIIIIDGEKERQNLIRKMKEIAGRDNRPSVGRDADNIKDSPYILVVGTAAETLGLDCGFCGYPDCAALKKAGARCAYNSMDLGIALGSAVSFAASVHIDNRLMYSIGKAALELGIFKGNIRQAIGIPLSATGKNPFFDRK